LIQLILLVVGVIYIFRRSKYSRLSPEDYPHVPEERFLRWKHLEIISIDIFLWSSWGGFIIGIVVLLMAMGSYDGMRNAFTTQLIIFGFVLVGVAISAIFGSMAAAIRKREGIDSPLTVRQYARPVQRSAKDFIPPLVDMLKDPDKRVRELTIERLAEMGSAARRALPTLRNVAQYDKEENIRDLARDAIGKIYAGR
jgi:hypothetical protein